MTDNSIIRRVKITGIISETANAKTFILEPLDGWKPDYKAGQFLTLVFYTKHGEKRRSYSLSSSPSLNEPMSITVKKVENGEFSRRLTDYAVIGDVLHTAGIQGQFTLPGHDNGSRHLILFAAGSGIVPCYSLLKTALAETEHRVTLIYSNKHPEDTIFLKALNALQENYAQHFRVRFLFGNSNDLYNRRLSRWLLDIVLKEYGGDDFSNTRFYLCGPFDYMQAIEITLRVITDKENIIKENFSTLPRLVIPKPPDSELHNVTIHINGHTYSVEVQYPRSILASAKAKGIELPYSCEAGRCSSCAATCISGKVWMAYNEVLTDNEVNKGRVLVCQGYPVGGDVEISYSS